MARRANRLGTYAAQLRKIYATRSDKRRRLLRRDCQEDGFVKCIGDCAYNILKGNIPLSNRQKKNLSKHRKLLRTLAGSRNALTTKRRLLVNQKGGAFLGALLGPIISTLGGLLGGIFGKN